MHLSLTLLAALASPPQDEDPVLRFYDVRALTQSTVQEQGVDLRHHLEVAFLDELEPDSWDVRREEWDSIPDYGWTSLLLDALGPDWPDQSVYAEERGGLLSVYGTEATQVEAGRILAEVTEHLLADVRLELFLLKGVPPATASVLSASETDALLPASEVVEYAAERTRFGRVARLGRPSYSAALIDYDVEVAQHAATPDPQVTVLQEGHDVGVLVEERPDGRHAVRLWGRHGELREMLRVPLEPFGGVSLDQPRMTSTLATSSAALEDGGALLVRLHASDAAWLLRVRARRERTADRSFVALGELVTLPLRLAPPSLASTQPSGGLPEFDEEFFERQMEEETLFSPDSVHELLWEELASLEAESALLPLGSALYVRGDAALRTRVRERVSALHESLVGPTVELDLRLGLVAPARAAALAAGTGVEEFLAAASLGAKGCVRAGDALFVSTGEERLYLADYDVEIAQAAAIADPIIGSVFEGISCGCRPDGSAEGAFALTYDLVLHTSTREQRRTEAAFWAPVDPLDTSEDRRPTGYYRGDAMLELPSTVRAAGRGQVEVAGERWELLLSSALGGDERVLVAFVRAAAR